MQGQGVNKLTTGSSYSLLSQHCCRSCLITYTGLQIIYGYERNISVAGLDDDELFKLLLNTYDVITEERN